MRRWGSALLGAVIGTLLTWGVIPAMHDVINSMIPAGRWLEVQQIAVGDTREGVSPSVEVKRIVRQSFSANRTVTLRMVTRAGLEHVCARSGEYDYRVGEVLPPVTDLDWWMNIPVNTPCDQIGPGRYVVTMAWVLRLEGFPPKVVRAISNEFEVTE